MNSFAGSKFAYLATFAVISIAVAGYFIGLQAPMNPALKRAQRDDTDSHEVDSHSADAAVEAGNRVVPATHYAYIGDINRSSAKTWATHLSELNPVVERFAVFEIKPGQKEFALAARAGNRAFNGAPPTIPHPVDQTSTQSCLACHGEGALTATLRIPKMSHALLANCTQCHIENSPQHMAPELFRENSFVGLAAPTGGSTAYAGAPPMIPHSTWMRSDCMSCHGFSGLQGIRTTHPWRNNCQQCHGSSSALEQSELDTQSDFLPPLLIK